MKKLLLVTAISTISNFALAGEWSGSLGVSNIETKAGDIVFDVSAYEFSTNYTFNPTAVLSSAVEVSMALSVDSDEQLVPYFPQSDAINADVTFELDYFYSVSYVASYQPVDKLYLRGSLGAAVVQSTADVISTNGVDSQDFHETGLISGFGAGFQMTDSSAIELQYRHSLTSIDTEITTLAYQFKF